MLLKQNNFPQIALSRAQISQKNQRYLRIYLRDLRKKNKLINYLLMLI